VTALACSQGGLSGQEDALVPAPRPGVPTPTGMSAADLDRALAWLLQAPPPRLLAAPRAGAGVAARPGSAAWLVRLAQSCGALPGRCAPLARRPAAARCRRPPCVPLGLGISVADAHKDALRPLVKSALAAIYCCAPKAGGGRVR